ncbi:unnamed protein product, partial [Discosporangium mesarthrocarpum]
GSAESVSPLTAISSGLPMGALTCPGGYRAGDHLSQQGQGDIQGTAQGEHMTGTDSVEQHQHQQQKQSKGSSQKRNAQISNDTVAFPPEPGRRKSVSTPPVEKMGTGQGQGQHGQGGKERYLSTILQSKHPFPRQFHILLFMDRSYLFYCPATGERAVVPVSTGAAGRLCNVPFYKQLRVQSEGGTPMLPPPAYASGWSLAPQHRHALVRAPGNPLVPPPPPPSPGLGP